MCSEVSEEFRFKHKQGGTLQIRNEELEAKAQEIAQRLGLKYEYHFAGYGDFEVELKGFDSTTTF